MTAVDRNGYQSITMNLKLRQYILFSLVSVVSGLFLWILLPFYGILLWAVVIAVMSAPIFTSIRAKKNCSPNLSAALTVVLVFMIVLVPLASITASLTSQLVVVFNDLQTGQLNPEKSINTAFSRLPSWARRLLQRFGLIDFSTFQQKITDLYAQISQTLAQSAFTFGQFTFELFGKSFVTLYLAFYLIRDAGPNATYFRRYLPASVEHNQLLIDRFIAVIHATVKGNLLIAVIQGILGGIAFWFLDLSAALLLAVLMALLSLVPAVGTALVWVPVAIYLFSTGNHTQALALVIWGAMVIGLVDNFVRPMLVGQETQMPNYVVLVSTLGGLAAFGINGFILGPLVAAMFITLWHIQADEVANP